MGNIERVELEDDFYAIRWPEDNMWVLKRGGIEYISRRTLQELRRWIAIRKTWRDYSE